MTPSIAILTAINVLALGFLVWAGLRVYQAAAPLWLFPRGEFERARRLYDKLARRGILTSTRLTGRYGVAACDLQLGRMREALEALRALPYASLGRAMRFGVDVAIGSALLQLDEEPGEAKLRFARAADVERAPDVLLGLALAELSCGDVERAEELYDEAAELAADGAVLAGKDAIAYRSASMVRHATVFLSAWYLARTARMKEAGPLLMEVVEWPVRSWITQKAAELLASIRDPNDRPPPLREPEPPSTGAMVVPVHPDED